jgi:hypothetical protein
MTEIPIREAFSSRRDAEAARDRLEYGGFARSRIQLLRAGDEFLVMIYPQPDEREHAQDLINRTGWLPDWASSYGRRVAEHAPSPGQSLLGLALIAGAGAALYWAFSQTQQGGRPRVTYQGGPNPLRSGFGTSSRERPTAADQYRTTSDDERRRSVGAGNTGGSIGGNERSEARADLSSQAENMRTATGTTSTAVE